MKKLLLSCTTIFFAWFAMAQNTSNLTISTTGNSNLKIRLANKKYTLQDKNMTFQAMQPGTYMLSIYQLQKKAFGGGTEYVTVFDKSITLTAQKHMEICVLRFGKVAFDERMIERDEWNDIYNNPEPDFDRDDFRNGNRRAVDATEFAKLRSAISGEFSDDDKMTMAKVVLKNNMFTTDQLKKLVELFFYDDKKLVFAKYAYDYCVDKGNYYQVATLLFYESNKKSLLEFIGSR